jgi:hypothetical protein
MISSDDGFDAVSDEVVATVADHDAARPIVETLLLAGLGPSLRDSPAGLQVTVVAGQGERAREALGLAPASPARASSEQLAGRPGEVTGSATTTSPPSPATATRARGGGDRSSTLRVVVIFAVALVVIPALAFYISFRAAGG